MLQVGLSRAQRWPRSFFRQFSIAAVFLTEAFNGNRKIKCFYINLEKEKKTKTQ